MRSEKSAAALTSEGSAMVAVELLKDIARALGGHSGIDVMLQDCAEAIVDRVKCCVRPCLDARRSREDPGSVRFGRPVHASRRRSLQRSRRELQDRPHRAAPRAASVERRRQRSRAERSAVGPT